MYPLPVAKTRLSPLILPYMVDCKGTNIAPVREIFSINLPITYYTDCIEFFFSISTNDIHLILGKYDFTVKDEPYGFLIRKLQTIILHPKYNTYAMEYDLALLRFNEPVKFQPNILPVCMPEDNSNFEGLSAHITGWGTLYYGKR